MGAVVRGLGVAIVCAGCGSFAEADDDWTNDVAGSTPSAEVDPHERTPAQTNAAPIAEPPDPEPAVPPAASLVFSDDFGRPGTDVRGAWTFERGSLEILAPPDAGRRLLARSDESFASSELVKRLDGVVGDVKASARIRVLVDGPFESSDFCEVFTIRFAGNTLASFFVNGSAQWSSWIYGANGSGGNGQWFGGITRDAWADLGLELKWDASTVTLFASVDGVVKEHGGVTLPPVYAGATPSISVGAACSGGVLPAVTAAVDEVTVTIPAPPR